MEMIGTLEAQVAVVLVETLQMQTEHLLTTDQGMHLTSAVQVLPTQQVVAEAPTLLQEVDIMQELMALEHKDIMIQVHLQIKERLL
jgi:hypothetical protein